MSTLLDRFLLWRARRRHLAHLRWCRRNRILYPYGRPLPDTRDWSREYMESLRK